MGDAGEDGGVREIKGGVELMVEELEVGDRGGGVGVGEAGGETLILGVEEEKAGVEEVGEEEDVGVKDWKGK